MHLEKLHLNCRVSIFYEKNIFVFYKQSSYYCSNVKNDLNVKQLAKQPPLMQNILAGLWVKKFTFSNLSSLKLNLSATFFGTT